jgi:hypothetical protein
MSPFPSRRSIRRAEHYCECPGFYVATIELCDFLAVRTYIPEPRRPHRSKWADKPAALRRAVSGNRRRVRRAKGKALQRRRSEVCERSFAHVCETGGSRRSWLRGLADVTKRYVIAAAAHNLGRLLRLLTGVGKPKALQGGGVALLLTLWECFRMTGQRVYQAAAEIALRFRSSDARSDPRTAKRL